MAELMEVTLNTTYFNQRCVNRWNYVASGTPAAVTLSFALAAAMGFLSDISTLPPDTIGGELQVFLATALIFNSSIARAVYIDDDFYDAPMVAGTTGSVSSSNAMSPVDAFGFFSSRVKQSIGRGYKRFPGVTEGAVDAGGVIASGAVAALEALSGFMSDTLTYDDEGNTLTFVPAIVQKEKYVVESSGKDAYRYYASQATQLTHTAQGVVWANYEQTRSQTSRQYGRGQ